MTTAAPKARSVRNRNASATVSVAASETGPGVMRSAAVEACKVSGGMERLRVRWGDVRFAPGASVVKRVPSLLLDFRGEVPEAQARRILAIRFEDGEDGLRGMK